MPPPLRASCRRRLSAFCGASREAGRRGPRHGEASRFPPPKVLMRATRVGGTVLPARRRPRRGTRVASSARARGRRGGGGRQPSDGRGEAPAGKIGRWTAPNTRPSLHGEAVLPFSVSQATFFGPLPPPPGGERAPGRGRAPRSRVGGAWEPERDERGDDHRRAAWHGSGASGPERPARPGRAYGEQRLPHNRRPPGSWGCVPPQPERCRPFCLTEGFELGGPQLRHGSRHSVGASHLSPAEHGRRPVEKDRRDR